MMIVLKLLLEGLNLQKSYDKKSSILQYFFKMPLMQHLFHGFQESLKELDIKGTGGAFF